MKIMAKKFKKNDNFGLLSIDMYVLFLNFFHKKVKTKISVI